MYISIAGLEPAHRAASLEALEVEAVERVITVTTHCVTEWRFNKYRDTPDGIGLRKLNQVERTPITHCRHLALLRQRQCIAYH